MLRPELSMMLFSANNVAGHESDVQMVVHVCMHIPAHAPEHDAEPDLLQQNSKPIHRHEPTEVD